MNMNYKLIARINTYVAGPLFLRERYSIFERDSDVRRPRASWRPRRREGRSDVNRGLQVISTSTRQFSSNQLVRLFK